MKASRSSCSPIANGVTDLTSSSRHMLQRMQTGEFQTHGFREAVHDVESLDGLTRRALHQVVDGADDHEAIRLLVPLKTDVAIVRSREAFRFRKSMGAFRLLDDTNEGLLAVHLPQGFPDVFVVELRLQKNVSRGQC